MKSLFDLHTHTIASGHAFSTLKENIEAARERGLAVLGLSDHGVAMPGAAHPFYFGNYKIIPEMIGGVRILKGIESNVLDFEGAIDLDDGLGWELDYVIASLHLPCIVPGTVEENTRALVGAMENPFVKIIGHPDDDRFPLDQEELVLAARRERVALEINNSSLRPGAHRKNARKNLIGLLSLCHRHEVSVIMGSDAHIYYDIGELGCSEALLLEVGFPPELVLNYRMEGLDYILNREEVQSSRNEELSLSGRAVFRGR